MGAFLDRGMSIYTSLYSGLQTVPHLEKASVEATVSQPSLRIPLFLEAGLFSTACRNRFLEVAVFPTALKIDFQTANFKNRSCIVKFIFFQKTSNGKMTKTKVIDLKKLSNFIIDKF